MERIETIEDRMDSINELIENITLKLEKKVKEKELQNDTQIPNSKKNYPLHILIEKDLIDKLKNESKIQNISLGELCRRKLRQNEQLDRIERKIDKLLNKS